jgi:plasmid stability protein
MGTITLRNVPDSLHARWKAEAARRGLGVPAYLRELLQQLGEEIEAEERMAAPDTRVRTPRPRRRR